jgi:hypothetical protein
VPELGSFRTFCSLGPWPTGEIGFVSHNRPARAGGRGPQAGRPAATPYPICNPQSAIEELGSFCTFDSTKLGLFRTIAPRPPTRPVPPGRAGIGFVSHILLWTAPAPRIRRPPDGPSHPGLASFCRFRPAWARGGWFVLNPQSEIRNRDTASVPRFGQLGSFCTIGFVSHGWPPAASSPRYPILPKFGLVLRNCAPGPRSGCSKLGSFCTFCPRRPRPPAPIPAREKLGLFCILRPRGPGAAGLSPIRNPQSEIRNRGIGFVSHVSALGRLGPLPVWPNWVRLAHLSPLVVVVTRRTKRPEIQRAAKMAQPQKTTQGAKTDVRAEGLSPLRHSGWTARLLAFWRPPRRGWPRFYCI